jgi:hypothetical protein
VDPVPDPLLLRKSDSSGNRTWTSGYVIRNSDHWTTEVATYYVQKKPVVSLVGTVVNRVDSDFVSKNVFSDTLNISFGFKVRAHSIFANTFNLGFRFKVRAHSIPADMITWLGGILVGSYPLKATTQLYSRALFTYLLMTLMLRTRVYE